MVLELTPRPPGWPAKIVARIAPDADLGAWETAVQTTIAERGFPTPIVRAHGEPTERLPGVDRDGPCCRAAAAGRTRRSPSSGPLAAPRTGAAGQPRNDHRTAARNRPRRTPRCRRIAAAVGVSELLDASATTAEATTTDHTLGRLVDRLVATRPPSDDDVICHGDIHPFNVLDHAGDLTLLDWTAARIADRCYDLGFTSLLVSVPPLAAPRALQPVIGSAARPLARRFVRLYEQRAGISIDATRLAWYRDLQTARVLTDLANWRAAGTIEIHRSHPWLSLEQRLLAGLQA